MNEGWIKIHRKILDSAVFDDEKTLKVWMWCLLKASHRARKILLGGIEVELKRGQFISGTRASAKELKMPATTFYRRLKRLEKTGNVKRETKRKFTLVEVVKWSEYQDEWYTKRNNIENKQECKNKRKSSYGKRTGECRYKGLFGEIRSSLTAKDFEKCGCPLCVKDLIFRTRTKKGANK